MWLGCHDPFWWPLDAGGLYLHRKVYTTFLWTHLFLAVLGTTSLGAAFLPCCLLLSCSIALILFRLWQGCSHLCTGSGSSRGGCMQSHRTPFFVSSRWSVFYQGNSFFFWLLQVDVQSVPTVNVLNVLSEWVFSNKSSAQQGSQR
jgi:hypothetical protein